MSDWWSKSTKTTPPASSLAELLGDSIKRIQLDTEILDWLRFALEESQKDRKQYSHERTLQLQSRYQFLQNAIDSAYEDRIGGIITQQLFARKSALWRSEMADIEVEVEKLRNATEVYHDEALKLLQLAEVAHERYVSADMETKAVRFPSRTAIELELVICQCVAACPPRMVFGATVKFNCSRRPNRHGSPHPLRCRKNRLPGYSRPASAMILQQPLKRSTKSPQQVMIHLRETSDNFTWQVAP